MEARFSLQDVAEAAGLPARTIRYYIQKGLLPGAQGRGKSAYYTETHVQQLAHIAQLRDRGLSLDEIRESMRSIDARRRRYRHEAWEHINLHDGLVIQVRDDAPEAVRIFLRRVEELAEEWFDAAWMEDEALPRRPSDSIEE